MMQNDIFFKVRLIFTLALVFLIFSYRKRGGKKVAELFIGDLYASIIPPVKQLRSFHEINLQSGESRVVKFTINKRKLGFY